MQLKEPRRGGDDNREGAGGGGGIGKCASKRLIDTAVLPESYELQVLSIFSTRSGKSKGVALGHYCA